MAQWISAIAAVAVACIAGYGVNRAVPYFENLNLREANAQLHIGARRLEAQRAELETENAALRVEQQKLQDETTRAKLQLSRMQAQSRNIAVRLVCSGVFATAQAAIRDVLNKTLFIRIALNNPDSYPDHAVAQKLTVRSIFELATSFEYKKGLVPEDLAALETAWKRVADTYAPLIDLVLIPDSSAQARTSVEYMERIKDNVSVARELFIDVVDACLDVADSRH